MLSVLGFLIILGPLVIVHEFGHYIFARIFNVRAEAFSIGFGPKLWSKQIGETEWRVSAIPMGGYVKLLGEDREAELKPEEQLRALHRQKAWKRFFIFFGGPLFNFAFAILVFMAILLIGEPQVGNVIGRVVHHSAAEKAGFLSGDQVLAIDGQPVKRFEELMQVVSEKPGQTLDFEVKHPGATEPVSLKILTESQTGFSVYGEQKPVGDIDGFLPAGRGNQAGVSDPASPAAKAGFHTGDLVTSFNGTAVESWEQLEKLYEKAPAGQPVALKGAHLPESAHKAPSSAQQVVPLDASAGTPFEATLTKSANGSSPEQDWGLRSSELFVDKPVPDSPAAAAGIRHGDRLIAVGAEEVYSFFDLREAVQKSGEKTGKVLLRWEHDGKPMSADLTPKRSEGRDPTLKKTTQFTIGVMPLVSVAEPVLVITRVLNPFALVYKASERMVTLSYRNFVSIGKMFTGDVSVGTLGGPILIGKIAGESLTRGLIAFLTTMAILSIGLGVLNVLPVPVLDGGHLLLLLVESVRGKPLTLRQMEIVQGVGLVLILALMGLVLTNDISRLPYF